MILWSVQFAINVEGSFYCAREAAKDMMSRNAGGSIVMIGSMSGAAVNIPQPQSPYNASSVPSLPLTQAARVN